MTDPTLDGYRRLGCAILLRAWSDCYNTNGDKAARAAGIPVVVGLAGDARAFLQSDAAQWLVAVLDLDRAGLDRALGELPPAEWSQLRLLGL